MIRLRQIVFAAPDLDDAARELESTLGLGVAFHDPGVAEFGLINAVYPVGDQFVEIVSPDPAGTTSTAVDRFLDRNGGPGGYMLILQTDRELDSVRAGLDGVRIVYEAVAPGVVGLHLHPADVGGAIVSIDRTDDWDEWPWGGPGWRDRRGVGATVDGLAGVDITTPDPSQYAHRWRDWFGGELDGDTVRFNDGTDVSFVSAESVADRASVVGFRFRVAPGHEAFDTICLGVRCSGS